MVVSNEAIGERVRSLLEGHAMTQAQLATSLGLDGSAISRSIRGTRTFKPREVALIAQLLGVPVATLIEGESAASSVLYAARKNESADESAVDQALDRAKLYLNTADLAGTQRPVRSIKASTPAAQTYAAGEAFAAEVLRQCGLDTKSLPVALHELAAVIEKHLAIQVAVEPLSEGLDGLSVNCAQFGLAMVSTRIAPTRQRWTLAHEVGHILLGDAQDDLHLDVSVYGRSPLETRANAFAAAFLMPPALVRHAWGPTSDVTESKVVYLLEAFGVSLDALAYRLHNLGVVNALGRDQIRAMRPTLSIIRNQGTRQSEAAWLPSGILQDAVQAYDRGDVGLRWLADLVDMDLETLTRRMSPDVDEVETLAAVMT